MKLPRKLKKAYKILLLKKEEIQYYWKTSEVRIDELTRNHAYSKKLPTLGNKSITSFKLKNNG
jgi:hypothetical protein